MKNLLQKIKHVTNAVLAGIACLHSSFGDKFTKYCQLSSIRLIHNKYEPPIRHMLYQLIYSLDE